MISIVNRWRQFGRRYFWPHLLFGMVAASLGVHSNWSCAAFSGLPSSLSHPNQNNVSFNGLTLLYGAHRHSAFNNDCRYRCVLLTVMQHFSFSFAPLVSHEWSQGKETLESLQIQQLVLFCALNALSVCGSIISTMTNNIERPMLNVFALYNPGLWLAQVQGIRAGPWVVNN